MEGKRVNGKKYRVKIFSTEQDKSDVPLVVNGHNVMVQRNKDVILDEAYVEVLRNAVITTIVQDPETGVKSPQEIQVFPFQAVELAA